MADLKPQKRRIGKGRAHRQSRLAYGFEVLVTRYFSEDSFQNELEDLRRQHESDLERGEEIWIGELADALDLLTSGEGIEAPSFNNCLAREFPLLSQRLKALLGKWLIQAPWAFRVFANILRRPTLEAQDNISTYNPYRHDPLSSQFHSVYLPRPDEEERLTKQAYLAEEAIRVYAGRQHRLVIDCRLVWNILGESPSAFLTRVRETLLPHLKKAQSLMTERDGFWSNFYDEDVVEREVGWLFMRRMTCLKSGKPKSFMEIASEEAVDNKDVYAAVRQWEKALELRSVV